MEWEYYNWECWHDRPKFGINFNCVWQRLKELKGFKLKMLGIGYIIWGLVVMILQCSIFYLTLPFAFINEWVRSW